MTVPEDDAVAGKAAAGRLLLGRYRLLQPIARGGMAEVWEGRDEVLARPVAIKLLHPPLAAGADFRERFRREAVSAARLSHPNVVATFDTGDDAGLSFIVMELVRGRTLRDLLEQRGSLAPAEAAAIAVQTADALIAAHTAGLVHRDLKPANILLCDDGADGPDQVKVADFGIARMASGGPALTQPGTMLGTARYLSPEQVEGEVVDGRADVYALGVVLYEMLAGRAPFDADSEVAIAVAHLQGEPRRLRQIRPGIPRPLEQVVSVAMARFAADRYQSAAELRAALANLDLAPDDAVPARGDPTPPSGVAPAPFRQAERPWLVPAGLIVLASVLLVVAGVLFSRSEVGQELLNLPGGGDRAPSGPVVVTGAHSFDPEGTDGEENEAAAGRAVDGDPATRWSTDRYFTRGFGGLKPGVGLRLDLAGAAEISLVTVTSPTRGWSAQVFVADEPAPQLAGWGDPEATMEGVTGDARFELDDARGASVLVWFTGLGEDNRVEVGDVTVEGPTG